MIIQDCFCRSTPTVPNVKWIADSRGYNKIQSTSTTAGGTSKQKANASLLIFSKFWEHPLRAIVPPVLACAKQEIKGLQLSTINYQISNLFTLKYTVTMTRFSIYTLAILLLDTSASTGTVSASESETGIRGTILAPTKQEEIWRAQMQHDSLDVIPMDEMASIHRQTQSPDDIHLNLVYNNHPHETHRYRYLQDGASNTPSSAPTSTVVKPIRIVFETTELEINGQSQQNEIQVIIDSVLPEISNIWSSILSVTPVQENILIPSNVCHGFFPNTPSNITQNGVEDADIVIFVSGASVSSTGKSMCGSQTLASASFCNLDQIDRPVIGFINFCLDNMSSNVDKLVKVGVHEVAHVLGWNDDLLKYFRDGETGEPLTSRPFESQSVTCVDGSVRDVEMPGTSTVQMRQGSNLHGDYRHYEIVTPSVKQVVRNQFGCQTLEGARLENQPTKNSCIGAHFDERLFFTEAMGPIFSSQSSSILSPLTVSLLEDSGFYTVHYSSRHVLNSGFGLGAGCDFVSESCIDESTDKVKETFEPYFCDSVTKFSEDGIDSSSETTCDPSFSHVAYCDLFDFSGGSPRGYSEPSEDAIQYFSNQDLGVVFTRGDYCPIPTLLKIDCTDTSNYEFQQIYPDEVYGSSSKCFNTQFQHPQYGNVNRGACLKSKCNPEDHTLEVYLDGETLNCEFDGQVHDFPLTQTASFECPPLRSICPQFICPALCSARGTCNYDLDPPKCECFDEADKTIGCFGSDYQVDVNDVYEDSVTILNPNSGNQRSSAFSVIVFMTTLYHMR